MADYRDSSSSDHPTIRFDRLPLSGIDVASVLKGAAIGAIAGAAAAYFLQRKLDTGDEPPIRVKGGSMEFQLLSNAIYWKDLGGKKWKPSGGTLGKEEYKASIIVKGAGKCPSQTKPGEIVKVTHNDGTWVELKGNGKQHEGDVKRATGPGGRRSDLDL